MAQESAPLFLVYTFRLLWNSKIVINVVNVINGIILTDYCRSVTIVTKNKTTFFTQKIDQFHPKTGQFWHFFEVKNVVNFSNSSRQYSVNGNSTVNTGFWQFCWFSGFIFVKIPPKFFKKLQNDLWHAKVNV